MKKPPCTSTCPDRTIHCHSTCEKYKKWKSELDLVNQRKRKHDDDQRYFIENLKKHESV